MADSPIRIDEGARLLVFLRHVQETSYTSSLVADRTGCARGLASFRLIRRISWDLVKADRTHQSVPSVPADDRCPEPGSSTSTQDLPQLPLRSTSCSASDPQCQFDGQMADRLLKSLAHIPSGLRRSKQHRAHGPPRLSAAYHTIHTKVQRAGEMIA